MTYATAITARDQRLRVLVKIAGVPGYLTDFDADTYDDGGAHGSLTCYPHIIDSSYSAGRLDHERHHVTQSTLSLRVLDSEWLRGVFARRASLQYAGAALTAAATTVQVQDASAWSAGSYAHLGRETVKVNSVDTGADTLSVTRGVLGTTAESHPTGTAVSTTPRHWVGRKAWLVLGAHDGASWVYSDPFGLFRLSASPAFADGVWSLELSDGLELGELSYYVGFVDVECQRFLITSNASGTSVCYLYPDKIEAFLESGNTNKQPLHVLVDGPGGRGVFLVLDVDTSGKRLEIHMSQPNLIGPSNFRAWLGGAFGEDAVSNPLPVGSLAFLSDVTARPVYNVYSQGFGPAEAALRVMLSTTGAAADNYDLLPGTAATADAPEVRAGCGLTTSDVDAASWSAAGFGLVPCRQFLVGVEGPGKLADLLSDEVCPLLGGYWYVTRAGKIAFKTYSAISAATSADYTITDSNLLSSDNALDDESSVVSRIVLWADYDWAAGEFRRKHVLHDNVVDHVYGRTGREVEIKSRFAMSGWSENVALFYDYRSRYGQGAVRYAVSLPWSAHTLEPGDYVSITNSRAPSQTSSSLGVSTSICEVVSIGPDFANGTVRAELVQAVTTMLVSPSVTVGSNVTGTLWNASLTYGQGALNTEIAVGWVLRAIDPATGAERTGTATVTSVSSTSIGLNANPTGLANGDVLIFANHSEATSTVEASYSSAHQQQHAFIGATGTLGGDVDRWS